MSSLPIKPYKAFITYPFTWAAGGFLILLTIAFILILQPSILWVIFATVLAVAGFVLWFVLAFKSEAFRKHLNRMPYEDKGKAILELIQACPENFKGPALESIELIRKVNTEFPEQTYSYELELMLSNIHELSKNHKILYERFRQFGDAEQKKRMEKIMAGQLDAIRTTLATLKTFSGNLTLLAADAEQSKTATDELKDVNQGLKEVIEEL